MNIDDRVFKVISQVMGVSINDINEDSSPDTIEKWDSLQHINLVMALEEEFEVHLGVNDIIEMLNVGLIVLVMKSFIGSDR